MSLLYNNSSKDYNQRNVLRDNTIYPRPYVRIKAIGDQLISGGLIIDSNSDGIGIISGQPLPVGTRIAINLNDEYMAVGEVVDLVEEFEDWNWNGMSRMGVRFIEKVNWPQ